MAFTFFKKETFGLRTQETFVGKRCEIYLPKNYFNKADADALAVEIGDRVRTIALFWFNVDGNLYEIQLPTKIEFSFSGSEKKKFKLKPELPEGDYNVYILEYGDAFIYDIMSKKDIDNFTVGFIKKIIENAKLPNTMAYSDSLRVFLNAMLSTGVTEIGVSAVSVELLLSELYRNKSNLREPFRKVYNGKDYDYKLVGIRKIPELNNTFTSLIGEDVQNQLVASILRKREGAVDRKSPVEEVIKY